MVFSASSSGGCCRQPPDTLQGRGVSLTPTEHSHLEKRDRLDTTMRGLLRCRAICSASETSVSTCSLQADVLQRLEFILDTTSSSPVTSILTAAFQRRRLRLNRTIGEPILDIQAASTENSSLQCAARVLSFCDSSLGRLAEKKGLKYGFHMLAAIGSLATSDAVSTAQQPSLWCPMMPPPTTAHSPNQSFGTFLASFTLTSCHFPSTSLFAGIVISCLTSAPFFTAGKV